MDTVFASTTRKLPKSGKRRICFPITSRAYYGRSQLLIKKLHDHPAIELELMLGGSILLDKYSRHIAEDIEAGGFTISTSLFNVIEGGNHVAMAKTACLTALEFTNGFHAADPDIVVICGDRFEQLAIARFGRGCPSGHPLRRGTEKPRGTRSRAPPCRARSV